MKTGIRVILSVSFFLLCFSCHSSAAWQFYPGADVEMVSTGAVLLDPDNWSRQDLYNINARGCQSLAWLNLSQIEDGRLVPLDIKEKDYVLSGRYRPEGKKLAVFYSNSFRSLVKTRLREYLLKGFGGIVLAKVGYYSEISNSPINRSEMWRLIEELALEAHRINPKAIILVHDAEKFTEEISSCAAIDGIIAEGVFFTVRGRMVKSWERNARLARLQSLLKAGKMILVAEDARTESRRRSVVIDSSRLNLDAAIVTLPLKIERRTTDGSKK